MKIINKTVYDTRTLTSLMVAVRDIQLGSAYYDAPAKRAWGRVLVTVDYTRTRRFSVEAASADAWTVRLPRPTATPAAVARILAGRTTEWGPAGTAATARQIATLIHWWRFGRWTSVGGTVFKSLETRFGERVPVKAPVTKPKPDVKQVRYQRVLELERAWLRKRKLADTKLKKLKQKRRYYEKTLEVTP